MKIVSVVGARPQFIKAAPVSRVLRHRHQEVLLHTGQHYDHRMSQIFFDELGLPLPDINLGVGSTSHGRQTGEMMGGIEEVLLDDPPDWVLVYGDTNSTLAGALAAAKLHIPVAHVEAGLRSHDRRMPEEINRVLTDHVADLLLCPTQTAVDNLAIEGIMAGAHNVGDVMYDAILHNSALATTEPGIFDDLGIEPGAYLLATIHRPRNTDTRDRLKAILEAFGIVNEPIVFVAHPRTRKAIREQSQRIPPNVYLTEPTGYVDMLQLEQQARAILTDSGGVQKEAYLFGVPCITLREETEWVETVSTGWNQLVGAAPEKIVAAVRDIQVPVERPLVFGDGHAAERIVALLEESGKRSNRKCARTPQPGIPPLVEVTVGNSA